MLTSAANMIIPEITATTTPATMPASRPLLEIPVPVLGVSGTPRINKKETYITLPSDTLCSSLNLCNVFIDMQDK